MSESPHRVSPYRYALDKLAGVMEAQARHEPAPVESYSVTIGTTAKHASAADPVPKILHTFEVAARGANADAVDRTARRIADGLDAKYAHELDTSDDLAGKLAASVTP